MSTGNVNQPALSVAQIKSLTSAQVAALTTATIVALTTVDIAALTPSQVAALTPAQAAALLPVQIGSLAPAQVAALSVAALPAVTANAIAALRPTQVAALTPAQIAALTSAQVAALTTAAIAALSTADIAALTQAQLSSLTATQMPALGTPQLQALTPADFAVMSPVELAALRLPQVAVLTAAQVSSLTPQEIAALTPAQLAAFSTTAIAALSQGAITALTTAQMVALHTTQVAALQPAEVAALSIWDLLVLPRADVAVLNAAQAAALRSPQIAWLTPSQIAALTPTAIGALSLGTITALTAAQAAALLATQTAALTPAEIAAFSSATLAALPTSDVAKLTAAQAGALRPLQIPSLTPAQVAAVTAAAIAALAQGDLAALSPTQAAALTPADLNAIPTANLASLPTADMAALNKAQVGGLQASQIAWLTPSQIAALPAADLAALTPADVAALTSAQAAAALPAQVAGLPPAELPSLTVTAISSLSMSSLSALSAAQLAAFSTTQLQALVPLQIPALLPADLAALSLPQLAALPSADVESMTLAQVTALSPAQLAALVVEPLSGGGGSTQGSGGPQSLTNEAAVPQPVEPGQVVGLVLQNPTANALAARDITFGMNFAQGQVPAGQALVAIIGGIPVAVQMDIKTTYADGSVDTAVLTMQQPQLAAEGSVGVMLSLGGVATMTTSLNLAALTNPGAYDLTVSLAVHNPDGTTTPYAFNVGELLQQALAAGTVSYWLQGPQATQARIDVPVTGSLHLTFDITRYADGSTSTDVQFNNDLAMTASGGTLVYDTTITQNGAVVLQQNNITQYQYQTWDQVFWSNGTPQVNVQHDIQALENEGAVQAYDLTNGVNTSLITSEATQMLGAGFGILGNAGVLEYMPTTGSRPDIGPTTLGNALWLMTQDPTAAQYALAQAEAAGSVPWHLFDPTTGTYLMATSYPNLWADPRGGSSAGTTGLTQAAPDFVNLSNPQSGWAVDAAHEPDLDYIAYLLTGDRYYLDQLNAEASFDILVATPSARLDGEGIVANSYTQVRTQAWTLREVVEAAYANPDGSAEQAYFTQIMDNNFQYLLQEAASVTATEGDAFGYVLWGQGNGWNGNVAPWQEDYFATTVVLAAEHGNAPAAQLLAWESNFLVGLFNSPAAGFSSYDGAAYQIITWQNGQWLQSWAQIEQATATAGYAGGGTWAPLAYPAYRDEALAVLAGDFTVSQTPDALKAYGWLLATSGITPAWQAANPTWDIVPRLSDGNYLGASNTTILNDSTDTTIQGSNNDQLIFEQGSANVSIVGGSGINVLFAGSGNDALMGGGGPDFLYGGTGTDVLAGGAGSNYMEAGTGATTFLLNVLDTAQDIIADFKVGIDNLLVIGAAGTPDTVVQLLALVAGATVDGTGNAVLHLSDTHQVTLQGIGIPALVPLLLG